MRWLLATKAFIFFWKLTRWNMRWLLATKAFFFVSFESEHNLIYVDFSLRNPSFFVVFWVRGQSPVICVLCVGPRRRRQSPVICVSCFVFWTFQARPARLAFCVLAVANQFVFWTIQARPARLALGVLGISAGLFASDLGFGQSKLSTFSGCVFFVD